MELARAEAVKCRETFNKAIQKGVPVDVEMQHLVDEGCHSIWDALIASDRVFIKNKFITKEKKRLHDKLRKRFERHAIPINDGLVLPLPAPPLNIVGGVHGSN